ncbi:MAG: hypothetical protein WAN20_01375 [Pseudonocardiaceae bacterium]
MGRADPRLRPGRLARLQRAHHLGGELLIRTGLYNLARTYRNGRADRRRTVQTGSRNRARSQHTGRPLLTGALSINNLAVGFALGAYSVSLVRCSTSGWAQHPIRESYMHVAVSSLVSSVYVHRHSN